MFVCETDEGEVLAVKPMNCPGHVQIFNHGQRSYRELPIRMAEFDGLHRYESSGSLHGLLRVRGLAQDDAHIFCREDQIEAETEAFIDLLKLIYADLGVETALGEAGAAARPARSARTRSGTRPRASWSAPPAPAGVEVEMLPRRGRLLRRPSWSSTCATPSAAPGSAARCSSTTSCPSGWTPTYIGEDGQKHRPVMLHRAILGSLERFIGVLIEHYAGAFPLWLAPVQVVVATITSDADDYALRRPPALRAAGLRVETDLRNEKVSYKVREHSLAKVPVIAVVGRREAEKARWRCAGWAPTPRRCCRSRRPSAAWPPKRPRRI